MPLHSPLRRWLPLLALSLAASAPAEVPGFDDLATSWTGSGTAHRTDQASAALVHRDRMERLAADLAAQEARVATSAQGHAEAIAGLEARLEATQKRLRQSELQDATVAAGRIVNVLTDGPRMPNLYQSQTPVLRAEISMLGSQIQSRRSLAASEAGMLRAQVETSARLRDLGRTEAEREVQARLAAVPGLSGSFREVRLVWGSAWIEWVEGTTRHGRFALSPERWVAWVASNGGSEKDLASTEAERLDREAAEAERRYREADTAYALARARAEELDREADRIEASRQAAQAAREKASAFSSERATRKRELAALKTRWEELSQARLQAGKVLAEASRGRDGLADPAPLRARAVAAAAHRDTVPALAGKLGGIDPGALASALGVRSPG